MITSDYIARLARLRIDPREIEEAFSRSAGPGGQHVNKVSTAVTLVHRPSGTRVTVQESRSQARNRLLARERLVEALETARREAAAQRQDARERERRRKRPRPAGVKRRILESKRHQAAKKQLRRAVKRSQGE